MAQRASSLLQFQSRGRGNDNDNGAASTNVATTAKASVLTEEQRLRMENNRLAALERKRRTIQSQCGSATMNARVIKQEAQYYTHQHKNNAVVITPEQRTRMEENRLKALSRKRQRSQALSPIRPMKSIEQMSSTKKVSILARMEANRLKALERKKQLTLQRSTTTSRAAVSSQKLSVPICQEVNGNNAGVNKYLNESTTTAGNGMLPQTSSSGCVVKAESKAEMAKPKPNNAAVNNLEVNTNNAGIGIVPVSEMKPFSIAQSGLLEVQSNYSYVKSPPSKRRKKSRRKSNFNEHNFLQRTESDKCKHCEYPLSKHRSYFGEKMCKFSGKYQCSCGRRWIGEH